MKTIIVDTGNERYPVAFVYEVDDPDQDHIEHGYEVSDEQYARIKKVLADYDALQKELGALSLDGQPLKRVELDRD